MSVKSLKRRIAKRLPVRAKVFLVNARAASFLVPESGSRRIKRSTAGSTLHPKPSMLVDSFDGWAERAEALRVATDALDRSQVEYALMPERYGTKTIVLKEQDKTTAIQALYEGLAADQAWLLSPVRDGAPRIERAMAVAKPSKKDVATVRKCHEFRLFSRKVSAGGQVLGKPTFGVLLSFWQPVFEDDLPRPDGYTYKIGTVLAPSPNGICAYLTPESWRDCLASSTRWPQAASHSHIYQITDPIDVVYTWVDGDDPVWQRRKNEALGHTDTAELNSTSVNVSRYVSRDELMYSLRSIELYANWVRNIYIVTDHQTPSWLDTSNPRIKVVNHEDIFADAGVLPVFNSHAIESQLHHIPGLSNKFLYLNDDVFFGRLVQPGDFFHSARIGKYFPSKACLDVAPASSRDLPVLSAAKNARQLIADEFGVTITNKFKHTPIALQRDVLYEMEERFPELFSEVAASKFRHPSDYSIASGLYHFYAFATGRSVPGSISYGYQDISKENLPLFLARVVARNPYAVFCLNDTDSTPEQLASLASQITQSMDQCYPFKSSFEK
ncbi:MAG: stealth conserved region 3 domain-containing protein [Ancrocorticia sp.]|uniref:stealth conserved region 3 domain-containing protein n=1 Tax=Ancrocorticia sp. TaxID=2593684 RepID=UPI003F8D9E4E